MLLCVIVATIKMMITIIALLVMTTITYYYYDDHDTVCLCGSVSYLACSWQVTVGSIQAILEMLCTAVLTDMITQI